MIYVFDIGGQLVCKYATREKLFNSIFGLKYLNYKSGIRFSTLKIQNVIAGLFFITKSKDFKVLYYGNNNHNPLRVDRVIGDASKKEELSISYRVSAIKLKPFIVNEFDRRVDKYTDRIIMKTILSEYKFDSNMGYDIIVDINKLHNYFIHQSREFITQ